MKQTIRGQAQPTERFQQIEKGIHRNDNGTPSGWGLFWMHLVLMQDYAHGALGLFGCPCEPGTHKRVGNTWIIEREHAWEIRLLGLSPDADEHLAAGLLSGVNRSFQIMRDPNPDVGALLHMAIHLSELNVELGLRMSGIKDFVEIGVAVSEKGALDGGGSIAERRGDALWSAYEEQHQGESAINAPLRPAAFARENWRKFGFPSAGAAQRLLSRRLSGRFG